MGGSLSDISCDAVCVDPEFEITHNVIKKRNRTMFFQMTSDDFFAVEKLENYFPSGVDIAFLDGMHLFEYTLRDFINVERFCHQRSIILLHDCLPSNLRMTSRFFRKGEDWTGDVWKLIPILKKYRPDVRVLLLDCPPTGLVCCTNLDPESVILSKSYYKIVDEFAHQSLDDARLNALDAQFPLARSAELFARPEDLTIYFPFSRRPCSISNAVRSATHSVVPRFQSLFIVTSTLNPTIGVVDAATRVSQTREGILSIRENASDSTILFIDNSPGDVGDKIQQEISDIVDIVVPLDGDPVAGLLSKNGLKSLAETHMLLKALKYVADAGLATQLTRIFKLSGRYRLSPGFDINTYQQGCLRGKYVFLRRIQSWYDPTTYVFSTRLWSFDTELIDETTQLFFNTLLDCTVDIEHSFYKYINKTKVVEFDRIHCEGIVASTGVMISE